MQNQTAATSYFYSNQLLLFVSARQISFVLDVMLKSELPK